MLETFLQTSMTNILGLINVEVYVYLTQIFDGMYRLIICNVTEKIAARQVHW